MYIVHRLSALNLTSVGNDIKCKYDVWGMYGICTGYAQSMHGYVRYVVCNCCDFNFLAMLVLWSLEYKKNTTKCGAYNQL